jgi:surface polysaccharide O-acyltransferase-like enzyme
LKGYPVDKDKGKGKGRGRVAWIEWARALGACGVVLLHVFVSTSLATEFLPMRAAVYSALGIVLGRWAVPAFFMITGYLLMNPAREVGWRQVKRYVLRMVAVLATYGLAFALMEEVWASVRSGAGLSPMALWRAVVDVISASTWDHLWYVYALLGVYLLVPALRLLQARLGRTGFCVATVALFAAVLAIPTCLHLFSLFATGEVFVPVQGAAALPVNVVVGITCFCVGACLERVRLTWPLVVCGVVSLVVMLGTSLWGIFAGLGDCGFVFLQGSCFACAHAVLVLALLRRWLGDKPIENNSLVESLARDSFGVYVLHPLFVHVVLLGVGPTVLPSPLFEVVLFAVALGGSIVLTRVMRRVPYLGTLL